MRTVFSDADLLPLQPGVAAAVPAEIAAGQDAAGINITIREGQMFLHHRPADGGRATGIELGGVIVDAARWSAGGARGRQRRGETGWHV